MTVAYHKNECYEFVGCPDKLEAVRGGMQFLDWKGNSVSQLHISQPEFNVFLISKSSLLEIYGLEKAIFFFIYSSTVLIFYY